MDKWDTCVHHSYTFLQNRRSAFAVLQVNLDDGQAGWSHLGLLQPLCFNSRLLFWDPVSLFLSWDTSDASSSIATCQGTTLAADSEGPGAATTISNCGIVGAGCRDGFMLDLFKPSSAFTPGPASLTLLLILFFEISGSMIVPRVAREVLSPTLQSPTCRVKAKYSGRSTGIPEAPYLTLEGQESHRARLRTPWVRGPYLGCDVDPGPRTKPLYYRQDPAASRRCRFYIV